MLDVTGKGLGGERETSQSAAATQPAVVKKQLIIGLDHDTWRRLVAELRLERAAIDADAKLKHVSKRSRKH